MKLPDFNDLDLNVARIRIVLSLVAILSLYIDPSVGGLFTLDAVILRILLCHLAYSLAVYFALKRSDLAELVPKFTAAVDLVFATAVAVLTEGSTSPSYIFFLFAIIAVGFRNGFRAAIIDTAVSMALYLTVIAFSHGATNLIIMRVVYLAIAGLLIGFFGQQRAAVEARLREFETKTERETIARSLHDGYVQALAAVNLRLESCRELLSRGQSEDAF